MRGGGRTSSQEGLASSQAAGCDLVGGGVPRGASSVSPSHVEDPSAAGGLGSFGFARGGRGKAETGAPFIKGAVTGALQPPLWCPLLGVGLLSG